MASVSNGFDVTRCLEAASAIEADVNRLASVLTEGQFHAPSRGGGWSVGYCIEHLILTGQAYFPKWDIAIETAVESPVTGSLPYGWWQRRILSYAEDPSRFRKKAPSELVPCSRHSVERTVARFLEMHHGLTGRVIASQGLDVKRIKVQSPFFLWLWYPLGFSFDLALAHERRHLAQAWRVQRQLTAAK